MDLPILHAAALDQGEAIPALRAACEGVGFFYLAGADEPGPLLAALLPQVHDFFALPIEQRMAVSIRNSRCNRGYEPMQWQRLEPGAPPDLKEGFYIGPHLDEQHPNVRAGLFNQGPNQWPAALPALKPAAEAYLAALNGIATRLMAAMARSLGLPAGHFDAFCHDPFSILRLLHYPPQPADPQPGEKGCGAHTDWGCLTLLWQDDAGGLQVLAGGEWVYAPPIPGTFVVNIGDMFARWTNGRYRSTLHRVVNSSGRDRYSIPFFFEGNPVHTVAALPGCVAAGEVPRYPPITVSEHLAAMYRATTVAEGRA